VKIKFGHKMERMGGYEYISYHPECLAKLSGPKDLE